MHVRRGTNVRREGQEGARSARSGVRVVEIQASGDWLSPIRACIQIARPSGWLKRQWSSARQPVIVVRPIVATADTDANKIVRRSVRAERISLTDRVAAEV